MILQAPNLTQKIIIAPNDQIVKPELLGISSTASAFIIACLCGYQGDGNEDAYNGIIEDYIQCQECENWSHISCQREGRASMLGPKDHFLCDNCDVATLKNILRPNVTRSVC